MAKRKRHPHEKEIVRRTAVVVALVLFVYATSIDSPRVLVREARSMVGSAVIGMSAGVAPNPYNTVAAEIEQKEKDLAAREATIRAGEGGSTAGTRMLAAASFVTSMLVLVLVAGNYYFDFRRGRKLA